jgi:CHAT domain-containing protein/tetratricopeptide (TPR) repeat protein
MLADCWFRAGALALAALLPTLAVQVGQGNEPAQPEKPARPPYERLLQGEDAKRAAELEKRANEAAAADRQAEAVQAVEEVYELRRRLQGDDHYQTSAALWERDCFRKVAAAPAERRAEWQRAVQAQKERDKVGAAKAQASAEQLLALCRDLLGEQHPETAVTYSQLADVMTRQSKYDAAEPLYRKALDIFQRTLGEQHPRTAASYTDLAVHLSTRGRYAEAEPLFRRTLAIRQQALGEQHAGTADGYNNLANNLYARGKHAEAELLYRKALAIYRQALGEEHARTAYGYNNLAANLYHQGKFAEADPVLRRALAIRQQVLGEQHLDTARTSNNLAGNLDAQGKHAEAEPLYRKVLAIRQRVLGEQHALTANSYNNLASNLNDQGKYAEAESLTRRALAIYQQTLGDQHPETGYGYSNVAHNLRAQGKHAEAEPLYRKALAIRRQALGEQNPITGTCYSDLATGLDAQGKYAEAAVAWEQAASTYEMARLAVSSGGLNRSAFASTHGPGDGLAISRARDRQGLAAWQALESFLGRGVLEELTGSEPPALQPDERRQQAELIRQLDRIAPQVLALAGRPTLTGPERERLDALVKERAELDTRLAGLAARAAQRAVAQLPAVQARLPADAALLAWVDRKGVPNEADPGGNHWACVVRKDGPPHWERLPGSGPGDTWTPDDDQLARQVRTALGRPETAMSSALLQKLHAQRLAPVARQLEGVTRLIVLPAGWMAGIPLEALTDRYTVSYAPSATLYARSEQRPPRTETPRLLALGDPALPAAETPSSPPPTPPAYGLYVSAVQPDGSAAKAGLLAGDVLLRYGTEKLTRPEDLKPAAGGAPVPVQLWREGETLERAIPPGKLGVQLSKEPAALEVRSRREAVAALRRSERGKDYDPLPGTRREVAALAALFPEHDLLLGRDASEPRLEELARQDQLKQYRVLHFATHGEVDDRAMRRCALVLAQLDLPDKIQQSQASKKVYDGKLDVGEILDTWKLDADLVTLSACQTGLGQEGRGEGLLGFSQALLSRGARSVVLSLWKVDDTATALLMQRFYQNWLGKRPGLDKAMPKAEALREAKTWLRDLPRAEAQRLAEALPDAGPRAKRPELPPLPEAPKPAQAAPSDKPFAHPYYWAAFILIGDPS